MSTSFLAFFSGFPTRRFPDIIAVRLREALTVRDSLVLVSAWPEEAGQNDADAAGMHDMFVECAMPFAQYHVIDNRITPAEAGRLIREATCIFLMGGDATQQFQLMHRKGIVESIRKSSAAIMGVSAGSINMAKRAVDIWESLVPYEGLGLANITVKAHFSMENRELLQTLRQVSMEVPVCAMADESAIFVQGNAITYTGEIYWIDRGNVCPISQQILVKQYGEANSGCP